MKAAEEFDGIARLLRHIGKRFEAGSIDAGELVSDLSHLAADLEGLASHYRTANHGTACHRSVQAARGTTAALVILSLVLVRRRNRSRSEVVSANNGFKPINEIRCAHGSVLRLEEKQACLKLERR